MRFIGPFEFLIIAGLCLCLLGPFVVGLAVRIWRLAGQYEKNKD